MFTSRDRFERYVMLSQTSELSSEDSGVDSKYAERQILLQFYPMVQHFPYKIKLSYLSQRPEVKIKLYHTVNSAISAL